MNFNRAKIFAALENASNRLTAPLP